MKSSCCSRDGSTAGGGCPGIIMRLEDAALLIRHCNANVDKNDAFTNTMAPMWPILMSDRKIMEISDESL